AQSEKWIVAFPGVSVGGVMSGCDECSRGRLDASMFLSRTMTWGCGSVEGLLATALTKAARVWGRDFGTEPSSMHARAAACSNLRSAVALPLRRGGVVYGVIEFLRTGSSDLDEDTCQLFEALGADLGRFVEVCQFEAKLRQRT